MRLILALGGNGTVINVTILNDTGSTIQTVFRNDLIAMGAHLVQYHGYGHIVQIGTANGNVNGRSIWVETRIMNGTGASDWFFELGVIMPQGQISTRLTGSQIRNHFYFATAPGNQHLYIAEKKNGIVAQLPAI